MMTGKKLLLVDDDPVFCEVLAGAFSRQGFQVTEGHDKAGALEAMERELPHYAIIDLRIGRDSGLEIVELLARRSAGTRMIVLTGFGSIATAVEAIKLGAVQYLTKPATVDQIIAALESGAGQNTAGPSEQPLSVRRLEWEHIQKVLAENNHNISATARALGMHRRTLQRKLQKRPVRR